MSKITPRFLAEVDISISEEPILILGKDTVLMNLELMGTTSIFESLRTSLFGADQGLMSVQDDVLKTCVSLDAGSNNMWFYVVVTGSNICEVLSLLLPYWILSALLHEYHVSESGS